MAIVNLEVPFSDISGSLVKQGIINRRKLYRDENGKVVHRGKQEAYAVRHPRDYKKNPPQGEELQSINRFREAHRLTTELIHLDRELKTAQASDNPETAFNAILQDPHKQEQFTILQSYKVRYKKQLGKTADPVAPYDRTTHTKKHYYTLNTFIRAMLIYDLKAQNE